MTVVTDEDAAQIERLQYVLAQSVKEGLVERVRKWPGVHSAAALLDGATLTGHCSTAPRSLPPVCAERISVRCATRLSKR